QREPGVDDVLDDDDVPPGEVEVEVLHDADHPGGAGGVAVGRDGHKVDLDRQRDAAGEVGHEHHGALQDPDQQRRPALVVPGDLGAELGDAGLEHVGVDHHLTQLRAVEQVPVGGIGRHAGTVAPTTSGR